MNLEFDLENITTIEFGIGRDSMDAQTFTFVSVDDEVQSELREMAVETWNGMLSITTEPMRYEPSEKHGSLEYVYLPLEDNLAVQLRKLHDANNLVVDAAALSDPSEVFCYFVRLKDDNGRRLTGLRRATQFKGVLKKRLIRLLTDTLKIIEDRVFKLDIDFDLLIDPVNIHILRPSGFEFMGQIQAAVLAAVPENIKVLQKDIGFVDFKSIQAYAGTHPRAARYLASIRAQKGTENVDKEALKRLCENTGVEVYEANETLSVQDNHVLGFLEVLDRRRYQVELVSDSPECYRAPSRQKL